MNAIVKMMTMIIAGTLLASGCGQSNSGGVGSSNSTSKNGPTIKVKGLFIGMDINSVPAVLKENLSPPPYDIDFTVKRNDRTVGPDGYYMHLGGTSMVNAGPDSKVTDIRLNYIIVDALFNSADMEASDFVGQFVKAYKIPQMNVSDDLSSWVYTSDDGTKVTISDKKELYMEKVASKKERKQSFN
jgi:hypothetical protein